MNNIDQAYKKVSRLGAILLFIFCRKRFVERSAKHDAGLIITEQKGLREKYLAGQYMPDEDQLRKNAAERTNQLKSSFLLSGLAVVGSIMLAYLTGVCLLRVVGAATDAQVRSLQVAGAALLLWATLWELGWGQRSWGGKTLPERVHSWMFRMFYVLGTYCLFLSVTW